MLMKLSLLLSLEESLNDSVLMIELAENEKNNKIKNEEGDFQSCVHFRIKKYDVESTSLVIDLKPEEIEEVKQIDFEKDIRKD